MGVALAGVAVIIFGVVGPVTQRASSPGYAQ